MNSCCKKCFDSERAAKKFQLHQGDPHGKRRLRIYFCHPCRAYHLTREPRLDVERNSEVRKVELIADATRSEIIR